MGRCKENPRYNIVTTRLSDGELELFRTLCPADVSLSTYIRSLALAAVTIVQEQQ